MGLVRPVTSSSVELDNEGRPVLRVVDAAPFAYEPDNNTYKVSRKQNFEIDLGLDVVVKAGESLRVARLALNCDEFSIYGRCDARHNFRVELRLRENDVMQEAGDPQGDDPYDSGFGSRSRYDITNGNGFVLARKKLLTPGLEVYIENLSDQDRIWTSLKLYVVGANG